jgi:predicted AlkP superfamily phosphohydrolase/phosphomutase
LARGARLLVVGLDGASHGLLERFGSAGRLPALSGLARHGAAGMALSGLPPTTMPAWSSILTGVNPGAHGLFDFIQRRPGRYELSFTDASARVRPGFMRLLSDQGARVAQLLVPSTWPPEPLCGAVVSGFDSPVALAASPRACHPPGLWEELQRRFGGLAYAGFGEIPSGPGWHRQALGAMEREIARKEQVCRWLLSRERWDAYMVVFGETDTAGHHLWRFHDPASPRHPARCDPTLRAGLQLIYERLDRSVERLMAWAQPDLVCVVSDHGMGGAGRLAVYINRFLEARGWLSFSEGGQARTRGQLAGLARGWALRGLPASVQQRLFRGLPRAVVDGIETRTRYGAIDFARTRAWSDELSYAATVHLNLEGRDPLGVVVDRDAALAALEAELLAWRVDGAPVVARVHRRESLYTGPMLEGAPDLVLELHQRGGYSTTPLSSAEVPQGITSRWLAEHELDGGRALGMNGTHRRDGILLLQGQGVPAGLSLEGARLEDVAPSLLSAMGWSPPAWMEGRDLLRLARRDCRPLVSPVGAPPESPVTGGDWGLLRRRLQGLGYLGGEDRP